MQIVLTGNTSFKIANFRAGLVEALKQDGHALTVVAPVDDRTDALRQMGCDFVPIEMDRNGTNPVSELRLLLSIYRELRRLRPDFVFSYTIKNNIYAGLACRLLGIPFAPNVTGLGPAFNDERVLNRVIRRLYRFAFRKAERIFFQNTDDLAVFLDAGLVPEDRIQLLPGSGVDLKRFSAEPLPSNNAPIRFLLVARMLRDKGIAEFAQAAAIVRAEHPEVEFHLLGPMDVDSKSGVTQSEMDDWVAQGHIEYLGATTDVRQHILNAHCVVLPSYYREGTPRSLLEAAAMARPLITTDMPGCRNTVLPGESGYLVAPRDADDLARACKAFIALSPDEQQRMGHAGRDLMERAFGEQRVIDAYRALLDNTHPVTTR